MPITKKGAAKAAPKKDTRKKPGPHARAKAREAKVATERSIPSDQSEWILASGRLERARAEQLELENIAKRAELERQGLLPGQGFIQKAEAPLTFTMAETSRVDHPEPSKPLTIEDALAAQERCLDYTAELVGRLEHVLAPLLRPENPNGAGGPLPEIVSSSLASVLRTHCARNAGVNARLINLLDRLDLQG